MIVPRPVISVFWALHRAVRRVSGGRLGTSEPAEDRMGTIFLHTVGRKTGRPRVNPLFSLADGPNLVVIASNAGAEVDPAWWLNLQAEPHAEVEVGGVCRPVRAREATADEANRLWPLMTAANGDYAAYRRAAQRPIPIVILEPR